MVVSVVRASGAGSLLPPGVGRRHAVPDGVGLDSARAGDVQHHQSGTGRGGTGAGECPPRWARAALLQRETRYFGLGAQSD